MRQNRPCVGEKGDSELFEGQRMVLTPRKVRSRKARIRRDPGTDLPVLTAGPKAPQLTSAEVREFLAVFP